MLPPLISKTAMLYIAAKTTYKTPDKFPVNLWKWPNFTPAELACRGTGNLKIDLDSLDKLQALRDLLGKPLYVNSAYRSQAYNKRIGGALHSQHMMAKAFDVSMSNHDPIEFEKAARKVGFKGFGYYPHLGFMHIDTGRERSWGDHWPETPPKNDAGAAKRTPSEGYPAKSPNGAGDGAGGLVDDVSALVSGVFRRFGGRGLR